MYISNAYPYVSLHGDFGTDLALARQVLSSGHVELTELLERQERGVTRRRYEDSRLKYWMHYNYIYYISKIQY